MSRPDTWQEEPRDEAVFGFFCHAPEGYFVADLIEAPPTVLQELAQHGPIECEGSGAIGPWCTRCRFGLMVVVE